MSYLIPIITWLILSFSLNPRFGVKIWPKIAYFNRYRLFKAVILGYWVFKISIFIYPILNLGPNLRFWDKIRPEIAYFNKYRWFKTERSSLDGDIGFLRHYEIFVTYLISTIIYPILHLGPNPHFWAQIWLKIAYFNKHLSFKAERFSIVDDIGLLRYYEIFVT